MGKNIKDHNFWGTVEEEKKNELHVAEVSSKPSLKSQRGFDRKWLLLLLVVPIILIVAVFANLKSSDNGPTDITGLVDIDNGDQKVNWDRYTTVNIDLSESTTITNSGVYHLSGSLSDGSVTVDSGVKGEVKLILDNVSITNLSGPAIACVSGDDLVIELVGENTLKDGPTYSSDLDEDISGAIYSKADLSFEGEGILNLTSNFKDSIVGKDDVKFRSGTYNINSTDDGIRGKDSVYITGGTFNIISKGDAIKSTNDTDAGKGFVLIEGGDIIISAGDDAVHAEKVLTIQNGTINVAKSYEGLEARKVIINGGEISVTASDDGINAGGSSDNTAPTNQGSMDVDKDCELIINGGNIYVNAGGDGIDSNGYIYFNGGKTVVDGPTNNGNGALDSGVGIIMTGGEVVAVGSSGMAENLGSSSSIYSISIYFTGTQPMDTLLEIKDSNNDLIVSHVAAKNFTNAAIGSTSFKKGETYTIYINGDKYQDFVISDIVTNIGNTKTNNMMQNSRK